MGILDFSRRLNGAASVRASNVRTSPLAESVAEAMKPFHRSEVKPQRRPMHNTGALARMMYASGEPSRLTGDWPTSPVHIDWIIQRFQRALVARSREQATNNDFMKAYIRLQRLNIVGPTGIAFHSMAMKGNKPDKRARNAVENAWKKWGKANNCDITGIQGWTGIQKQAIDTVVRDGESFIQIVYGKDVGPMGVALRLIDPQRCPIEYTVDAVAGGSNYIRQGVEFNQYGRPVAYHFTDEYTDRNNVGYQYNGRSYTRIPAAEIVHLFVPEFPSQKRGLPWMATGLFRAKQTQAMEDAAVVNARVGAAKMGFIQFKDGTGPEYDADDDEDLSIDAEAGTFPVLPSGAEFKEFAPQYPQGEFGVFIKHLLHGFAAGGGVSYHSLTGDLESVNLSSIRQGVLDEREGYKEKQEWLREHLCERIFEAVFPRILLAGLVIDDNGVALPASKLAVYSVCRWQPRRWQWIDPAKEVAAAESWKNNMLTSPSQLIREQGRDPEQVFQEFGQDIKAMKAAGIPDGIIASALGQKVQPTTPPLDDGEGTGASNPDEGDSKQ